MVAPKNGTTTHNQQINRLRCRQDCPHSYDFALETEIDADTESLICARERIGAGEGARLRKLGSHIAPSHGIDEGRDIAIVGRHLVVGLVVSLEIGDINLHTVRDPYACAATDGVGARGETDVIHIVVGELIIGALDADAEHKRLADIILKASEILVSAALKFLLRITIGLSLLIKEVMIADSETQRFDYLPTDTSGEKCGIIFADAISIGEFVERGEV